MLRIYGTKKGKLFVKFPKKKGRSMLRIKLEYYVDREVIKTIEGTNLTIVKDGEWTFQCNGKPLIIKQGKKGTLKLYKPDGDSKGARIGGVFSIPTKRPKPKKIVRQPHRWDYETERMTWRYYYTHIDDLTSKDIVRSELPMLVLL